MSGGGCEPICCAMPAERGPAERGRIYFQAEKGRDLFSVTTATGSVEDHGGIGTLVEVRGMKKPRQAAEAFHV